MRRIKAFGIGLNKTGTTTLAKCLSVLGYERHMSVRRDLLSEYREGRLDEIYAVADTHDSFEDWPWPLIYKELFFRFGSDARYILTTRQSAKVWLESLKRHSLRTPVGQHCRLLAFGYNYPHGVESHHLEIYERHNQEVRHFFADQNAAHLLLEISFDSGDGWEKLCKFLELAEPSLPFPHENEGVAAIPADLERENAIRIDEQLRSLGKT